MSNPIDIVLDSISLSTRDVVLSIIASRFIVDYGVVSSINSDKTVNVDHSGIYTPKYPPDGYTYPKITTNNIEVLYPSSANFSINFALQAGDPVLLLGLKDTVPSTRSATPIAGNPAKEFHHYDRSNLKAIPLAYSDTNAQVQMNIKNNLIQLKNTAQSFSTLIDSLVNLTKTMTATGTGAVVGGGGGTCTITTTVDASFQTQLASLKSQFDQLFTP